MSRGQRDFTSVSQIVATKYEVLCEHKVAAEAREMLHQMPGSRAARSSSGCVRARALKSGSFVAFVRRLLSVGGRLRRLRRNSTQHAVRVVG